MSSIRERASHELDLIAVDPDDKAVIMQILNLFFNRFDSGGAVSVMAPMLMRCLAGAPLMPLTGQDTEWEDRSETESAPEGTIYQNLRGSSVFKRRVFRSDRKFDEPSPSYDQLQAAVDEGIGHWEYVYFDVNSPGEGYNGFKPIDQFPYMPEPTISDPIVVMEG